MKAGSMCFSSASLSSHASWGKNSGLDATWFYRPAGRVIELRLTSKLLFKVFFSSRFVLMYSTVLCTQYNSALTTTIVGCFKVRCAVTPYISVANSLMTSPAHALLVIAEHPGDVHRDGVQRRLHLLLHQLHRLEYQVRLTSAVLLICQKADLMSGCQDDYFVDA